MEENSRKRKSEDSVDISREETNNNACNTCRRTNKAAIEVLYLPEALLQQYKTFRKVKAFYDWQREVLNDCRMVHKNKNFLLTAETGGGKTMVAELLILRKMFTQKCCAMLALPFRSLVNEKMPIFQQLASVFAIQVLQYSGEASTFPIPTPDRTLYVCTYEMAYHVFNSLKERDEHKHLGLLVIDEIHIVGEQSRGSMLERLVTNYAAHHQHGQIIAMSATVGNIGDLNKFIGGFHYHSSFRPVELKQHFVENRIVYSVYKNLPVKERELSNCDAPYVSLAHEIIPQHSVLVFCATKNECRTTAVNLTKSASPALRNHKTAERQQLIAALGNPRTVPEELREAIECGIAYHHRDVDTLHKDLIIKGFYDGTISLICATTTLANGVNLPVRRVIIKSPKIALRKMDKAEYLQMAGRAGRAGLDDIGECFIIAEEENDQKYVRKMVLEDPIPNCKSHLTKTLDCYICELIDTGNIKIEVIRNIINCSYYKVQHENVNQILDTTIAELLEIPNCLKQLPSADYRLLQYGRAGARSGISPKLLPTLTKHYAAHNYSPFSLILEYIPELLNIEIDESVFKTEYRKLPPLDKTLLKNAPKSDGEVLMELLMGQMSSIINQEGHFYAALIIYYLYREKINIFECAGWFEVPTYLINGICENVTFELKKLRNAAMYVDEMEPLRRPIDDLLAVIPSRK